jgi:predicted  nucleic acid-binding Zn-ribbon protein
MPPNSFMELNRSLFHSEVTKKYPSPSSAYSPHKESWLSCALASHNDAGSPERGSITSTVLDDDDDNNSKSNNSNDPFLHQQSQLLKSMVHSLNAKLHAQELELQRFPIQHDRYVQLFLRLESATEELECAAAQHAQLVRQAKSLEATLAVRDIELDDVSARQHDMHATAATAVAAAVPALLHDFDELQETRDTAIKQATQLAMQLAESQAAVDDLRETLVECQLVTAHYQEQMPSAIILSQQHQAAAAAATPSVNASTSTAKKPAFFWHRGKFLSAAAMKHQADDDDDQQDIISMSSISQDSVLQHQQLPSSSRTRPPSARPMPTATPPSESSSGTLMGLEFEPDEVF